MVQRTRGFTLIERLVAIAALALLAVMSWRGIDGMARAQAQPRERADAVLTLQGTLAQWSSDLDATVALPPARAIDWNGQALRLTSRNNDGRSPAVLVVAWTLRADATGPRWHRWHSPPLFTRGDWQQAWQLGSRAGRRTAAASPRAAAMSRCCQPPTGRSCNFLDVWAPAVGAEALEAAYRYPPSGAEPAARTGPVGQPGTLQWGAGSNATIAKSS